MDKIEYWFRRGSWIATNIINMGRFFFLFFTPIATSIFVGYTMLDKFGPWIVSFVQIPLWIYAISHLVNFMLNKNPIFVSFITWENREITYGRLTKKENNKDE